VLGRHQRQHLHPRHHLEVPQDAVPRDRPPRQHGDHPDVRRPINNGTTKYKYYLYTVVKHFWTHEFIDDGTIKLQHISGAAMLSVDDVMEYVAEIEPSPYGIKQSTCKLHESSGIKP
jgi:hypothetical protein